MRKIVKGNIYLVVFIVTLIDAVIGYSLFKSRWFSHLAIWKVIESNKYNDFYWQPENAPSYFRFEPGIEKFSIFRDEIFPLVNGESNELKKVIKVAKYVGDIQVLHSALQAPRLKWDSPEGILRQIRKGAFGANCFHRSILFSAYLSGLGLKSRLWALENEKFNSTAHTVNEVYIKSLKKWVFVDIMFGFYATERGSPLSFLELRERLLNDKAGSFLVHRIADGPQEHNVIPVFYPKLIKCVFLRARNDFIDKYNTRYGFLSVFQSYIDKLPDGIRIGASYLFSGQDRFVHYVDRFSKSLKSDIIIAKALFYFLVSTIFFSGLLGIVFVLVFRGCPCGDKPFNKRYPPEIKAEV